MSRRPLVILALAISSFVLGRLQNDCGHHSDDGSCRSGYVGGAGQCEYLTVRDSRPPAPVGGLCCFVTMSPSRPRLVASFRR